MNRFLAAHRNEHRKLSQSKLILAHGFDLPAVLAVTSGPVNHFFSIGECCGNLNVQGLAPNSELRKEKNAADVLPTA